MNSFDRVSGRLNLTHEGEEFLELTTNASLARTKKSGYNDTRNTGSNYFMQTRNLLWGLYWPTDYKTGELWTERYGSYATMGFIMTKSGRTVLPVPNHGCGDAHPASDAGPGPSFYLLLRQYYCKRPYLLQCQSL